jgi:hypothetical protein
LVYDNGTKKRKDLNMQNIIRLGFLLALCSTTTMQASAEPTEKEKLLTKLDAVCELTEKLLKTNLSVGTVTVLTEHYQELNNKRKELQSEENSTAFHASYDAYQQALKERTELAKKICARNNIPYEQASPTSNYQEHTQATTPTESTTAGTPETKQPAGGVVHTQQLPALCLAALVCVLLPYLLWPS